MEETDAERLEQAPAATPPLAGSLSQAMDVGTHQTYIENRIGGNGYKLETTLNQEEVLMSDNTRKALLPKFRQNL